MPKPTVYVGPSPNSYRVLIALKALAVDAEIKKIDFGSKELASEEFGKINPLKQLPTFVDADGQSHAESVNIVEFLFDKYDTKREFVYPKDSKLYWKLNETIYFIATTVGVFADLGYYFGLYFPSETGMKVLQDRLTKCYTYMDDLLSKSKSGYLVGDKLTIADLIAYPHTMNAEPIDKLDLSKYTALKKWQDKIGSLPYVKEAYASIA